MRHSLLRMLAYVNVAKIYIHIVTWRRVPHRDTLLFMSARASGSMPKVARARSRAARVVAGAGALFWGYFWFGLTDLLVVLDQDSVFRKNYILESGWGLLFLVLVAVPLVVLTVHPGSPVAVTHLAVVTIAVLLGGLLRPAWPQLLIGLGLLVMVVLVAWIGNGRLVRWQRPDPALSVLVLAALPAAVAYGCQLIRNTTVKEDVTNGVTHWPIQASLALAIVALVGLAAVTRDRLPGWTAGFAALWLGVESAVYPDLNASLGRLWGLLVAGWAVVVLVALQIARHRVPPPSKPSPP